MKKALLHTPEGVRDIYNEECEMKQILKQRLKRAMEQYGYHIIQTPTFEFFDIFGNEIGTTSSKELFKFFDRQGNTLVLRPDITPSVARAACKYYMEEDMPIRLYYMGNTFINNSSYQGRLKETTQLGAELMGDNSVEADAEIISMVVDNLLAAGLEEFQLSIGHADFFEGIVEAAGFDEDTIDELKELIANKNYFGVEEITQKWYLSEELKELFGMLRGFYVSYEEVVKAKEHAKQYPKVYHALERIEELHHLLEIYGIDSYVSYEPGIVSEHQYYTGIVFSGYTFGSGEPIVKGGRYDNLLSNFGKQSPSIGFAVVVDQLMEALKRQKITLEVEYDCELVIYSKQYMTEAIAMARALRQEGTKVELLAWDEKKSKMDYEDYANRNHRVKVTYLV